MKKWFESSTFRFFLCIRIFFLCTSWRPVNVGSRTGPFSCVTLGQFDFTFPNSSCNCEVTPAGSASSSSSFTLRIPWEEKNHLGEELDYDNIHKRKMVCKSNGYNSQRSARDFFPSPSFPFLSNQFHKKATKRWRKLKRYKRPTNVTIITSIF